MKWEDLPESTNVEDRRAPDYKFRDMTLDERIAYAKKFPRDKTLPDSELANQLGINDICQNILS